MQTPNDNKKQEAVNALIKIAAFEGVLLVAVVAIYLATNEMKYLIGGFVGVFLISGPMFFRWFNEHGKTMSASKLNSVEGGDV